MRRLSGFIFGIIFSLTFMFCSGNTIAVKAEEKKVYIGGMSAGFTLKAGGVQIIGFCDVIGEDGARSPALNAGLVLGDTITKVAGIEVESIAELNDIINKNQGKEFNLEYIRKGEKQTITIKPIKDKATNRYKIGILVRDSVSGIGTVTYIDQHGRFGALGHSVIGENKQELKISDGMVYVCSIVGIHKGVRGRAGELRGMFLNDKTFGCAEKLCSCGIFGEISGEYEADETLLMVASSMDARPGKAVIYSTISGVEPQKYTVEIVKVDFSNKENKNYVVKITDENLISETGGIVQGMSGSPIIQDGKLVGAITHVFLNDPTRGFGINIETMLKE